MKIAIVDDDPQMIRIISKYLDRFMRETKIPIMERTFPDGEKLLEQYDHEAFDLLLLDVEMPGMDGIEAARRVRLLDEKVIIMFITNMAQYAIRGYEVEAVDYVLKPLTYQDFAMKMQKVLRYYKRDQEYQLILDSQRGKVPVKISEIFYVEVIRHYLHYHTTQGILEVRGVMNELERELQSYHFARCSQSYLVNLAHVVSLRGNTVTVGTEELSVSRNRKNIFVDAFTRYIGGMPPV